VNTAQAGKKGGKARATNMTPKQRTASASKAALALWAKIRSGELGPRKAKRAAGRSK